MQEQHPCYYPGEFSPPTKMHLNALHWLLNRPEVSHVHVVLGSDKNGPVTQDQKARLWELMLKSSFAPQASVVRSKKTGALSEVYEIFSKKRQDPAYIALDEKSARDKRFQQKFEEFPSYGIQLVPSQFHKSSKRMHQAVIDGDRDTVKDELPSDFSDSQIDNYISILKEQAQDLEAPEEKSRLIDYKQQYTEMFSDGFWKSVFSPTVELTDTNTVPNTKN